MVKSIYYNDKFIEKDLEIKNIPHPSNLNQKKNVNINGLLNRVKIDQQSEKRKNFLFISFGILVLILMGIFVSIIR